MHFSKTLMSVSANTMRLCSEALDAAFKTNQPQVREASQTYALRDGLVMRVVFSAEIVRPEDN